MKIRRKIWGETAVSTMCKLIYTVHRKTMTNPITTDETLQPSSSCLVAANVVFSNLLLAKRANNESVFIFTWTKGIEDNCTSVSTVNSSVDTYVYMAVAAIVHCSSERIYFICLERIQFFHPLYFSHFKLKNCFRFNLNEAF